MVQREDDEDSDYKMQFVPGFEVDAREGGNESRFINDYRNNARNPNVTFKLEYHVTGLPYIACKVLRAIKPGEQLLADYGRHYWAAKESHQDLEEASTNESSDEAAAEDTGQDTGREELEQDNHCFHCKKDPQQLATRMVMLVECNECTRSFCRDCLQGEQAARLIHICVLTAEL